MITMSQAEFSRHMGYKSRSYVTQLRNEGRLVIAENGKVDVEASIARINETGDPNRDDVAKRHAEERGNQIITDAPAGKPKRTAKDQDPNKVTFSEARAKEQHYKSLQAELDYQKAIGELVPIKDMQAAVADLVTTFRQTLENIPHRISSDLVGKDMNYIRGAIKQELHAALSELEKGCAEKITSEVSE